MPLSRVAESFDFATEHFDVAIIDEASQCDVLGLLPLMIAKEVVIVGDHEQVSPSAVGQNLGQVQSLIDQYLQHIPNRELYDGRRSIYHLAQTCFGATIRLVEHFRCVPEIIQFSNSLCYAGDIRPLRESQGVRTRPFVLEHRVAEGKDSGKVNTIEATEVASLVVAATQQPEYAGATMGVISMVGDEQARCIDLVLRRRLSEPEYAGRRVLCGNAAEFQGDERSVMFLSMVNSSDGAPLPIRQTPDFRQRFNVASSRAKDQLWVVHSLSPDTELQPGNLRLRLIQHARNPKALVEQLRFANQRAQSEFERRVIRWLSDQSFRLAAQWAVGAFSINIVVFGSDGAKVAIECDGDRYHTLENLEADYRRQLMLERLGWRFIRIRSSRFFRDPDETMTRVIERLEELGIQRTGASEAPAETHDDELRERVVRRAAELRREWQDQDSCEVSNEALRRRGSGAAPSAPTPASSPKEPSTKIAVPATVLPGAQEPNRTAEDRQAWQMTLVEWKDECSCLYNQWEAERDEALWQQLVRWKGVNIRLGCGAHRLAVERARRDGLPVPERVLNDYPDLQ